MTQQPPPQPPRPYEGAPQQTAPLWYGQTQTQPQYQAQPQFQAYPPPPPPAGPRPVVWQRPGVKPAQQGNLRRLVELVAVAAVAAILASAGTYGVTRVGVDAPSAAQSRANLAVSGGPVVQADASAPNWTATAAAVLPSVVAISVEGSRGGSRGSGVIFDTKGHILTNNHVVTGAGAKISVTLDDKRTYDATIVGTDPSTDLAVVKLTNGPSDLKAIAIGDSNALKVGDPTMAVGNPLGLAGTVTTGIVSALNRPVSMPGLQTQDPSGQRSAAEPVVTNAVQTSAAINPGNSGGALVNAGGQLIGINASIATAGSSSPGSIGIGFAIPVNEARSIAEQLITSGKADHAYLGITPRNGVVADGSAKRAAAVAVSVASGTPAAKAGLREGDAIIEVDGEPVDGANALIGQIRERNTGDKVTLKFLRNGQTKTVTATLVSKPTTAQ